MPLHSACGRMHLESSVIGNDSSEYCSLYVHQLWLELTLLLHVSLVVKFVDTFGIKQMHLSPGEQKAFTHLVLSNQHLQTIQDSIASFTDMPNSSFEG